MMVSPVVNAVASLMLANAAQSSRPLTLHEITALTPQELAARLLPADVAPRIVKNAVRRQFLPGNIYWLSFWEKAKPVGPTVCVGMLHSVQVGDPTAQSDDRNQVLRVLQRTSQLSYGPTYPLPATDQNCAGVHSFATPAPEKAEATVAAIEQLGEAMRAASGTTPLPFELKCVAEDDDRACADPRAALAALPMDAFGGVQFESGRYRVVSERPAAGGTTIRVRQMMPAPDGGAGIPTIAFGPSPPDGKSWRVTLVGSGGRLDQIEISRTTIIYH